MKDKDICKLISDYKNGDMSALEHIWYRMTPLIKKFAGKTHFMEYDDSFQEYSIVLIEAVNKIQTYDSNGQCLKYFLTCIKNKFSFLYKNYCNGVANEIFDDIVIEETYVSNEYNDILFLTDIENFIKGLPSEAKRNIAKLSIIQQKSDTEIAIRLGFSRQYVNKAIYKNVTKLEK